LNGDVVTLEISLESSLLFPNNPSLLAKGLTGQILQILQTKISTTVKTKLGESVALGGIYERYSEYEKSGVPGLQDIPFVQYLFSNQNQATTKKSVLFLVTPRRLETIDKAVGAYLTLKSQRKQAPNLDAWVSERKYLFNDRPPSMALIIRNSLPDNDAELYRRGDILPMPIGDADTFAAETSSLKSFLYF
jgi:general secretion pathway protein D